MSTRNIPAPFFPYPPQQYEQNYFSDIVRSFALYIEQQRNPGESRATGITLTNLQTDDSGLETGAVFEHGGALRVPVINSPYVRGSVGTSAVGSVTVTISELGD